jgi:HAD superfamily hydrolase (TIGR01509 family)
MVKAVLFDCFGVLTRDDWKEFVVSLPEALRLAARDLNRAYGSGQIDKTEFLRAIKELTGKLPTDVDYMLKSETTKNTELLDFIAELKPKYKIGLLSNIGSNWIREQFLTPEEQKLFDVFIFSYEVKMVKPDPRIFELAAARLGVVPAECVLVDDGLAYAANARRTGMRFILYRNFEQAKADLLQLLADPKG